MLKTMRQLKFPDHIDLLVINPQSSLIVRERARDTFIVELSQLGAGPKTSKAAERPNLKTQPFSQQIMFSTLEILYCRYL
uniref:Phosphoribulokinase n=1 Tax=Steinernema glaseri TaxID=37863 RepID=A0A1I8ADD7_9BILA